MDQIQMAISQLRELECDSCVPKNVKTRILKTIEVLEQKEEASIKVSKALNELESITEENNMQPMTRTQIFSVVSVLEFI